MKKLLILFTAILFLSCNKDGIIEQDMPVQPEIVLDGDGIYNIKVGRELEIAPSYRNAEGASYEWSIDGAVVCRQPRYTFVPESAGRIYIDLKVSTSGGSARESMRVEVAELALPSVVLAGADEGFVIATGSTLEFRPVVADSGLETLYKWSMRRPSGKNSDIVSEELAYTFAETDCGEYAMRFEAENEDGTESIEFVVSVVKAEDMPFAWSFLQTEYNIAKGRRIRIAPCAVSYGSEPEYVWTVDGREVQRGDASAYIFTGEKEGAYTLKVTARSGKSVVSQELKINVCAAEGTYRRKASAGSSARWSKVFEFTAAPGQFVNENYTATTAAEACAYAESRLKQKYYVSLGGFGGYIIVGFDHSIANTGGYDFAISGNSFDTSSEPGIVWVMQDENGNGKPDDTWYELAGSDSGSAETIRDYAVTYYRPSGSGMAVPWVDNRGNSGTIDYQKAFHRQETYYPAWISADSYTLYGTCLKARNYQSGADWVQPPYDWGYVDNFSSVDRLSDDDNAEAVANPNHFKISNAVDFEGKSVKLEYIDFIKVQTGVNAKSGWLGELSTEVCDFYDYSLAKE